MDYNRRTEHVAQLPTTWCCVAVRDMLNEKTSFNHSMPQSKLNARAVLENYELFINGDYPYYTDQQDSLFYINLFQ